MNQWIGNLNWYFYPEMIYHVSHERMVYPELGIPGNDLIVQRAMPMIRALEVMEKELSDGRPFLLGDAITMADYFLLPTLFGFSLDARRQANACRSSQPSSPGTIAWMRCRTSCRFNATLPPRPRSSTPANRCITTGQPLRPNTSGLSTTARSAACSQALSHSRRR